MRRLCLILLLYSVSLGQINSIEISDAVSVGGDTLWLHIDVSNEDFLYGIQFDLGYSDVFTLLEDYNLSNRASHFSVELDEVDDVTRVLLFSPDLVPLESGDGSVIQIAFLSEPVFGEFIFSIYNPILGNLNSENLVSSVSNGTISLDSPAPILSEFPIIVIDEDEEYVITREYLESLTSDFDTPLDEIVYTLTSNILEISTLENSFIISPPGDWYGQDSIQIESSDGFYYDNGLIPFQVNSINDAPNLTLMDSITINEDDVYVLDLTQYVADVDDNIEELNFQITCSDDNIYFNYSNSGLLTISSAEDYFTSNQLIDIKVEDNDGAFDIDSFNFTIIPLNDAPYFISELPEYSFLEDNILKIALNSWDYLLFDVDHLLNELEIIAGNGRFTESIIDNDTLYIIPYEHWFGVDSLLITLDDGDAFTESYLLLSVESVNDVPIIEHLLTPNNDELILVPDIRFSWSQPFDVDDTDLLTKIHFRGDTSFTMDVMESFIDINIFSYNLSFGNQIPWFISASDDDTTIYSDTLTFQISSILNNEGPHWYVSPSGDDTNGNGSEGYPFQSIQKAVNLSNVQDTIFISSDTYGGSIAIDKGIHLRGIVVNGIPPLIQGASDNYGITMTADGPLHDPLFTIMNINFVSFSNGAINVTGNIFTGIYNCNFDLNNNQNGGAIYAPNSHININNSTFNNNTALDNGGAIYGLSSDVNNSKFIYNRGLSGNGGAIYLENSSIIKTSIFKNNHSDFNGHAIFINSDGGLLENNTFFSNNDNSGGNVVWLDNSIAKIKNSIFVETHDVFQTDGIENLDITYSNVIGNVFNNSFEGGENISQDPGFLNPDTDLFDLTSESPCIDTGDPDTDEDGQLWYEDSDDQDNDGSRKDMGAIPYYGLDTIPPSVTLISPNGGENYGTGSSELMIWSSNDERSLQWAKVYVSYYNEENFELMDSIGGPISELEFVVPEDIITDQAYAKVVVSDWGNNIAEDISDNPFNIIDIIIPSGSIISPAESFSAPENTEITIEWEAEDNILLDSTKIYFKNNYDSLYQIGTVLHSINEFNFLIPFGITDEAQIIIDLKDTAGNSGSIQSPFFSITDNTEPVVTIEAISEVAIAQNYLIEWNASDNVALRSHHIYFSPNIGTIFTFIDSVIGENFNYDWVVPNYVSSDARIIIETFDSTNLSSSDTTDFFNIIDTIAPTILVLYPTDETIILENTVLNIEWEASDNIELDSIHLFYLNNLSEGYTPIITIPATDSLFQYVVPNGITDSAVIKLVAVDIYGNDSFIETGYFTVTDNTPPYISINQLDPTYSINQVMEIQWIANDNNIIESIELSYLIDSTLIEINSLEGEITSYEWIVPNILSDNVTIVISVTDPSNLASSDTSRTFSILDLIPPSIEILTSTSDLILKEYDSLFVSWIGSDNIGLDSVFIYYSSSNDPLFSLLSSSSASINETLIVIPIGVSNQSLIKIDIFDDSGNFASDTSDSFTVTDNTPPDLSFTLPVDGVEVDIDDLLEISWIGSDNTILDHIDLSFKTELMDEFIDISTNLDPENSYTWVIPNTPAENAQIRGILMDNVGLMDTATVKNIKINKTFPRISNIFPDDQFLNFKDKEIVIEFSEKMDAETLTSENIFLTTNYSNSLSYQFNYDMDLNRLIITSITGFAGLDSINVILNSDLILSSNGYRLDGNNDGYGGGNAIFNFNVGYVCDLNKDYLINAEDFMEFQNAWETKNYDYELGPYVGEIPNVIINPDSLYNIDDVMSFVSNVNWYLNNVGLQLSHMNSTNDKLNYNLKNNIIEILVPEETISYELEILYDKNYFSPNIPIEQNKLFATNIDTVYGEMQSVGLLTSSKKITIPFEQFKKEIEIEILLRTIAHNGTQISLSKNKIKIKNIPNEFVLYSNYPNPFNPATRIDYGLPSQLNVQLIIFDILGREVVRLVNELQGPGYRSITWNGTDSFGKNVSAGMYFYMIRSGSKKQIKKMILLK